MSNTSHPLDRLVSVLGHATEQMDHGECLYFFDIHKLLYYLAKRLDRDNELHELLVFYWYEDGPVATIGQPVANRAQELGVLERQAGSNHFHPTGTAHSLADDEDVQEAKEALEAVLREDYDIAASYDEKLDQVYEDAPYEFQRRFKTHVLPMTKSLDDIPPTSTEEVYNAVSGAEAYLPLDPAFEDVNNYYSEYLDVSRAFLLSDKPLCQPEIMAYTDLSQSYWKLFCAKLRLKTSDSTAEKEYSRWEQIYEERLDEFSGKLSEFESEFVKEEIRHSGSRVSETSAWGQVANQLLNNSD